MQYFMTLNKLNALKQLYAENEGAANMLDYMATGLNRRKMTTVDDVIQQLGVTRSKAIHTLQLLANTGCGTFHKGRATKNIQNPTRVEWIDHYAEIGRAARGEFSEKNESLISKHIETNSEGLMSTPDNAPRPHAPLTIREAKRLLAEALGVEEHNIEITVKG